MNERRRGLGRGLAALIPPGGAAKTPKPAPSADPTSVPVVVPDHTAPAAPGYDGRRADGGRGPATGAGDAGAEKAMVPTPDAATAETALPHDGAPDGAWFAELPIDAITPNPRQPREVFDEDAMAELVRSIQEVGLLQPVVVRQTGQETYELIMGERRWRASREVGLERIPAIVRATDDDKLLLDALLENLHRAQLHPIEEANAYDQLLREFSCTHEQLADRIGRSRSQVSNTLRLLRLPAEVQGKVAAGVLSAGHARALVALEDVGGVGDQILLARRIVAEGLSVRSVEEIVHMAKVEAQRQAQQRPEQAETRRPKPRAGRRVAPALTELAERLSGRFDTVVRVDLGQKKGKIVVEFASVEDLERILATMAPGEDRAFTGRVTGAQGAVPDVPAQSGAEPSDIAARAV